MDTSGLLTLKQPTGKPFKKIKNVNFLFCYEKGIIWTGASETNKLKM
jgi:hypothetical protein